MQKKTLAVLALIATVSLLAFAQSPRGPMGPRNGGQATLIKKLKLSESQQLQMQKLRLDLMKKQTQLRAKVQTLQLDNKGHFLADKVDRKAIEGNVKAISDLQEQLKLNMVDHWFEVNAMLNAEQQKLWKKHAMQMGDQVRKAMREGGEERIRMRIEKHIEDRDVNDN